MTKKQKARMMALHLKMAKAYRAVGKEDQAKQAEAKVTELKMQTDNGEEEGDTMDRKWRCCEEDDQEIISELVERRGAVDVLYVVSKMCAGIAQRAGMTETERVDMWEALQYQFMWACKAAERELHTSEILAYKRGRQAGSEE